MKWLVNENGAIEQIANRIFGVGCVSTYLENVWTAIEMNTFSEKENIELELFEIFMDTRQGK